MGHRFSKLAVANNSTTNGEFSTINSERRPTTNNTTTITGVSNNSSYRIPIPLPSTTINVQIQESPTSIDALTTRPAAATASTVAVTASSNNRLSDSDSSSLASLTANSLQNRQIIIKIQLAKMENGNESQQQQEFAETASSSTSHDTTNNLETNFSQNNPAATQFVNLTVNGNIYYTNEGVTTNELNSLSSNSSCNSRNPTTSTSVYTNLNNNSNKNGNSSIEFNLNTLHIQEDWEQQQQQQQTNDNIPEYCEVLEDSNLSNISSFSTNEDTKRLDTNSTETFGCLNSRRKSKTLSRPTSSSSSTSSSSGMSTKRRCRDAIRRILEPTTKLSNNKNKENNNNKKHSDSKRSTPAPTPLSLPSLPSCSTVLPSTSGRNDLQRTQQIQIQPQQQLTTTTAAAISNNNLMPISMTTVAGVPNTVASINPNVGDVTSTTTTTANNQLPTAIWTSNRNDLIIPITSPPQFVVVQCPPSSVVTVGRIGDNSIRLTSTEVGTVNGFNVSNGVNNGFTATTNLTRSISNGPIVHSQVDFVHCLVPDLDKIVNSSFYWGKIDRYEAERLLEGKPEGTFLLRDSAQEEYLFSVTFRKYNRSLHARIEQSGHRFGFDCHDPGVFTAPTVTGLLQHYKDPTSVMFFEPTLTIPLHRKTVFTLQELARAVIVSNTTYDGINELGLPVRVKSFLKEYHYKQKLRVKPCDETFYACT